MKILIKFPSRGRPEKFKFVLEQYLKLQSNFHTLKVICTFDEDDESMNNNEIKNYLKKYEDFLSYHYGFSKNKIEAINADIDNSLEFDILILAADDLSPTVYGYDDIIVQDMIKTYEDFDGTLHYMNPNWEERLDIGCIMTKKYYSRFNFIYNPIYKTIYCDNEYMNIAIILNKHRYSPTQLFAHTYITNDETASRNAVFNKEDEDLYNQRLANNFFLSK